MPTSFCFCSFTYCGNCSTGSKNKNDISKFGSLVFCFLCKGTSVHEPVVRAVVKVAKVTDALVVVSATGEDWEQAVKNKTTATNTEAGVLINFFIIKIFKWMNLFIICNQQQINCNHIFKKFYSFNFTAQKKRKP